MNRGAPPVPWSETLAPLDYTLMIAPLKKFNFIQVKKIFNQLKSKSLDVADHLMFYSRILHNGLIETARKRTAEARRPMKILLVEDDSQLVKFIEKGSIQAGFSIETAMDGRTGLDMALMYDVDVAIIDIMLPLMDGWTLIREIRKNRPLLPILVLSAKRSVEDRVQGLEIGCDDYLTKPFSFTELIARIRAVVRRARGYAEAAKIDVSDLSLDLLSREVRRGSENLELLPKEFALLEYLARNKGRVVTRTQILEQVWGYQFDPESNVVDVHICRLREKLGDNAERKLIRTIRGVGYILKENG